MKKKHIVELNDTERQVLKACIETGKSKAYNTISKSLSCISSVNEM